LTILKLLKSVKPDGALLVTTPQKLSLDTIRKEITFCHKMKLKIIGLVENMSYYKCPCCQVDIFILL
jgi:Mrp family chromosome partitioning ATPase